MHTQKLPSDFEFLPEMYDDDYFPNSEVDKVKTTIQKVVTYLEKGETTTKKVQKKLDNMTLTINELQNDFIDHNSEIETGAAGAIAETVERILAHFHVDIEIEEAIREREW